MYFEDVKRIIERLQYENKEQQKALSHLLKQIKQKEKEQKETISIETTVEHMISKEGCSPEEVASLLRIDVKKVNQIKNKKDLLEIPNEYLNEEEIKKYNELIDSIRNEEIYKLINGEVDIQVLKFIDSIINKYTDEMDNYEEKEDDVIVFNNMNFNKLGIAFRRKTIKQWLVKNLFNEMNRRKQKALME